MVTRNLLFALLLPTAAACGDTTTGTDAAAVADLTVSADLTMTPLPDLARALDLAGSGPTILAGQNNALTFVPATVNIKAGTTVTWVFSTGGHNVVSQTNALADGRFCSPDDKNCPMATTMNAGTTYMHTFLDAGTFPYVCVPHVSGGMKGTVVVVP